MNISPSASAIIYRDRTSAVDARTMRACRHRHRWRVTEYACSYELYTGVHSCRETQNSVRRSNAWHNYAPMVHANIPYKIYRNVIASVKEQLAGPAKLPTVQALDPSDPNTKQQSHMCFCFYVPGSNDVAWETCACAISAAAFLRRPATTLTRLGHPPTHTYTHTLRETHTTSIAWRCACPIAAGKCGAHTVPN